MDSIKLSDSKSYPLAFDVRGMKEFKAKTGCDILTQLNPIDTDHLFALAFVFLKSGHFNMNPTSQEFPLNEDQLSRLLTLPSMTEIAKGYTETLKVLQGDKVENGESEKPGEILGTV
jgi:hypothetical protein